MANCYSRDVCDDWNGIELNLSTKNMNLLLLLLLKW